MRTVSPSLKAHGFLSTFSMFPYNDSQTSCSFSEFTSTGDLLMPE
ncbi:Microsomal glutathione S-transferase 3, partial [Araneus ventricosus]